MSSYYDDNGHLCFVKAGLDRKNYMSFRKLDDKHAAHRIKSPALPLRDTKEEAERDLDAYAVKNKWKRVG